LAATRKHTCSRLKPMLPLCPHGPFRSDSICLDHSWSCCNSCSCITAAYTRCGMHRLAYQQHRLHQLCRALIGMTAGLKVWCALRMWAQYSIGLIRLLQGNICAADSDLCCPCAHMRLSDLTQFAWITQGHAATPAVASPLLAPAVACIAWHISSIAHINCDGH